MTPHPVSPTNSKLLYGAKPSILANGIETGIVNVRIRDADNAPLAGWQTELIADREDVVIIQPGLTNADGLATGYVSTTTAGPVLLRARVLITENAPLLTTPEALAALQNNSAGAIWLTDAITLNFYSRDIVPKPKLASTSERNVRVQWSTSRYFMNDIDGIRVRIEAVDATQMPTKIFAYQMLPTKPGDTDQYATFDHVCSSVDLAEYPEDEPTEESRPAWFRIDYVDVFLRSREEVRAFIAAVLEDIKILKNTLDIGDELLPAGDVWIGAYTEVNPPEDET